MLLRSPCKNLKPYDNPFCDFSIGGAKKKWNNLPKIVVYLSCSAGRTHFARTKISEEIESQDPQGRQKKGGMRRPLEKKKER
jgi:hypothetical protein